LSAEALGTNGVSKMDGAILFEDPNDKIKNEADLRLAEAVVETLECARSNPADIGVVLALAVGLYAQRTLRLTEGEDQETFFDNWRAMLPLAAVAVEEASA
jgi:hypothetical protein